MKFFKKRAVAIVILVLVVVGMSLYGLSRPVAHMPQVEYGTWICDDGNALSSSTEEYIQLVNSHLLKTHGTLLAVATTDTLASKDIYSCTGELWDEWGLGPLDMLVLIDLGNENYYVGFGSLLNVSDSALNTMRNDFETLFYSGNVDSAVQTLCGSIEQWYDTEYENPDGKVYEFDSYDEYYEEFEQYIDTPIPYSDSGEHFFTIVVTILVLAVVVIAIVSAASRRSGSDGNGGNGSRRARFVPIFVPRRRHWGASPPPPPPHHGPRPGAGPRPGGSPHRTSAPRSGGFGGGSRGGGFGGGHR